MLKDKILRPGKGLVFYGLTPPKINTEPERIVAIAQRQVERLKGINLDGLVLYDIQDEAARTEVQRPFPYMPTIAPDNYAQVYLEELRVPKIIYQSVGKYSAQSFRTWLSATGKQLDCLVFVGSPSKNHVPTLTLPGAYEIKRAVNSPILLGGITIPERHAKKCDEHLRMFDKIDQGCSFFISQCVYNLDNAKSLLSDYYYKGLENDRTLAPVVFTLTPCGSTKTLEFMQWLGIDMPRWLGNDLKHSNNILQKSLDICRKVAAELLEFSASKNIPVGFNIESVAIRKDEIDASIDLLKYVSALIR